jgi:hypothetical protein
LRVGPRGGSICQRSGIYAGRADPVKFAEHGLGQGQKFGPTHSCGPSAIGIRKPDVAEMARALLGLQVMAQLIERTQILLGQSNPSCP